MGRRRTWIGTLGALVAILALVPAPQPTVATPARAALPLPNIIVILTDDQRADSLFAMPDVNADLMSHGITFPNTFATNPLCCPSRASILTGGYSHTTGVYTNVFNDRSPYGAWQRFHDLGDENGTIAVALQSAGYRTAMIGKYLNGYQGGDVPGWDVLATFSNTKNGGAYYDYSLFVKDGAGTRTETHGSDPADYSTTVLGHKTMQFLRSTDPDTPFFLYLAPYATHGRIVPAPVDVGSYDGFHQVLSPNFNEKDVSDKPAYIRALSPVDVSKAQTHFRLQYETLQSVDRMVHLVIQQLASSGELHDTLFIFMSDNGIAFGEHRWTYKTVPYEESIRLPLVVRYDAADAAAAGTGSTALVSNIDIAPTIADAAGIGSTFTGVGTVDGSSMLPLVNGSATSIRSRLLLEHLDYSPTKYHVPAYCGLRTSHLIYVRYGDGFEEVYRLDDDPYELRNVVGALTPERLGFLRSTTRALCDPLPPGYSWP